MNKALRFRAFTLLEVLVACVVFLMVVLIITQLLTDASRTTVRENARMSALGEARQALDRFGLDWASRIRRSEVRWSLTNTAVGPSLTFFSQVPAYEGDRKLASVSYRIHPDALILERGVKGYFWETSSPSLEFSETSTPLIPEESGYENLSSAVFWMRVAVVRRGTGEWERAQSGMLNPSDYDGLVLTLAWLDERTRANLTDEQIKSLIADLNSAIENTLPGQWLARLNSSSFLGSLPPAVAGGLRFQQRIFSNRQ